ncbi:hypothetical protein M409DRAFT_57585 [Zasmidium cellare ATCC 36951]|uniref:Uncharacterized protein n=1 Tax=Zasmidium cellare ATCC 36951 TaxID=1080233 RepID=A0A6A6C7Y9_ZASCE|nr:uncharacterized protein M409DRAFT_57585 [Zasmidium cellare ATCC 36951]KAF2163297.1 hypothetical protein M409DRAFT_57585 [Zasmidium cellare ATCC 36951]
MVIAQCNCLSVCDPLTDSGSSVIPLRPCTLFAPWKLDRPLGLPPPYWPWTAIRFRPSNLHCANVYIHNDRRPLPVVVTWVKTLCQDVLHQGKQGFLDPFNTSIPLQQHMPLREEHSTPRCPRLPETAQSVLVSFNLQSTDKEGIGKDPQHAFITRSTARYQNISSAGQSSGVPLTESNLAAHNAQVQARDSPLRRWYSSTDDTIFQARDGYGWARLVESDPLAAEIDAILRERGQKK